MIVNLTVIKEHFYGCEVVRTKHGIVVTDQRNLGQELKLIFDKGGEIPTELLSRRLTLDCSNAQSLLGFTVNCRALAWFGLYRGTCGTKNQYLEPMLPYDDRVNAMAISISGLKSKDVDGFKAPKNALGDWRISLGGGETLVLLLPMAAKTRAEIAEILK